MYKINCGVCNAEFTSEFNGKEKCNLVKHIKTHHKDITKEEYLIKYFYNNEIPLCACGCGKETEIYKFRYHKYYMNHKKYVPLTDDIKFKIKLGQVQTSLNYRIKMVGTSEKILSDSYIKYQSCEYSMSEIAKNIQVDRRTLKKFWKEMNLTTESNLKILNDKTKFLGFKKNNADKLENLDNYLSKILLFLDINRNSKHTINQVRNELDIPFSANYLLIKLREKYGEDVLSYFKLGSTSNIEIEFYSVLKFYFGDRVRLSFRLEDKYYDYIVDGKLLIELDGTYWHSFDDAKLNDKYKNELAIRNGFQILRIDEKNVKDINIIIKIVKILDKL